MNRTNVMTRTIETPPEAKGVASEGKWPGIESRFRLIVVAGLRAKQLLHGSSPRIESNKARRRHTSIALEEVKRGLVKFSIVPAVEPIASVEPLPII